MPSQHPIPIGRILDPIHLHLRTSPCEISNSYLPRYYTSYPCLQVPYQVPRPPFHLIHTVLRHDSPRPRDGNPPGRHGMDRMAQARTGHRTPGRQDARPQSPQSPQDSQGTFWLSALVGPAPSHACIRRDQALVTCQDSQTQLRLSLSRALLLASLPSLVP